MQSVVFSIIECLDKQQPHQALRIIQGQKTLTPTLLALKSLTLFRCGKFPEALALAQQLINEQICSKLSIEELDYINNVFSYLHRHDLSVQLYQMAHKMQPNNEEIAAATFLAYVRAGRLDDMQTQAMTLYRKYKKVKYLLWNVVSLISGSKKQTDEMQKKLKSDIATRFMDIAMTEKQAEFEKKQDKTSEDNYAEVVRYYVDYLREAGNITKAFDMLKADKQMDTLPFDRKQMLGEVLLEMKEATEEQLLQANAIYAYLLTKENYDEWTWWTGFLESLVKIMKLNQNSKPSKVTIDWLLHDKSATEFPVYADDESARNFIIQAQKKDAEKRGPFLAEIDLDSRLLDSGFSQEKGKIQSLLVEYYAKYGSKAVYFYDIKKYMRKHCEAKQFLQSIADKKEELLKTVKDPVKNIFFELNYRKLEYLLLDDKKLINKERLLELYVEALQHGKHLLKTENQYGDEFLILYVQVLLDLSEPSNYAQTIEKSILLLEYALKKSPFSAKIMILLVRLYCMYGAVQQGLEVFSSKELAIKHVQYESLSYIVYYDLSDFGIVSKLANLVTRIRSFCESEHGRETAEVIDKAYRKLTLSKIQELEEFKRRMDNSLLNQETFMDMLFTKLSNNLSLVSDTVSCLSIYYNSTANTVNDFKDVAPNEDLSVCIPAFLPTATTLPLAQRQQEVELKHYVKSLLILTSRMISFVEDRQKEQEEAKKQKKSAKKGKGPEPAQPQKPSGSANEKFFKDMDQFNKELSLYTDLLAKLQKTEDPAWQATTALMQISQLAFEFIVSKYSLKPQVQNQEELKKKIETILNASLPSLQKYLDGLAAAQSSKSLKDQVEFLRQVGQLGSRFAVWWTALVPMLATILPTTTFSVSSAPAAGSSKKKPSLFQSFQSILLSSTEKLQAFLKEESQKQHEIAATSLSFEESISKQEDFKSVMEEETKKLKKAKEMGYVAIANVLDNLVFNVKTMKT